MLFQTYGLGSAENYNKFVFWTDQDTNKFRREIGPYLNGDPSPERKKMISQYGYLDEKYAEISQPGLTFMTPFPAGDRNIYCLFGSGNLKITYSNGEEQTLTSGYTSETWTDYADIWQYNRDCFLELYDGAFLVKIELPENKVKSDYSIKICALHADGSLKTLTKPILNQNNQTLIVSSLFNFNAINYNMYDRIPIKGSVKTFENSKGFTLRTKEQTYVIHLEEL